MMATLMHHPLQDPRTARYTGTSHSSNLFMLKVLLKCTKYKVQKVLDNLHSIYPSISFTSLLIMVYK
jgi:hypothetical protein